MNKIINYFKNIKKQKIGLTLSGGATKGFAIFAIIEKLIEKKIQIDMISGTSVGAIIGAYYSIYGEINSLKEKLLSFNKKDWKKFADFSIKNHVSIIKGEKYFDFLNSIFKNKTFQDCKIPLIICSTNLKTGKIEYFQRGKIIDAIMASSAYPGVFPPYKISSNLYVDGGVLNNLPYEILFENKMDKVIAINLGLIQKNKNKEYKTLFSVFSRSIDLMIANASKKINYENKKLFIIEPEFARGFNSSWGISNLDEKYKIGLREFKKREEELIKWLNK